MKNNTSKQNKQRRSLKGKWGKVGAPPKATKFPKGAFTMETLVNLNKNQCKLSLYNKVDVKLADGTLIALKARKQKRDVKVKSLRNSLKKATVAGDKETVKQLKAQLAGLATGVGRPKDTFVLKDNFDSSIHEKADAKAKTPKTRTVVAVTATVTPTAPPVPEASVIPASSTVAATVEAPPAFTLPPVVETPAEQPVVA